MPDPVNGTGTSVKNLKYLKFKIPITGCFPHFKENSTLRETACSEVFEVKF